MKKIFILFVKIIGLILLIFIGFYFVYKTITKDNLEKKLTLLNNNWVKLLGLLDDKNILLNNLIKNGQKDIHYKDSLSMSLIDYSNKRANINECNEDFIYQQYLSNKFMLPLIVVDSNDSKLPDDEKNKIIKKILDNIDQINKAIEEYNSSVKDYNFYYASFPNFIIAKSYNFKRKNYFEIKYGIENIDPKTAKEEMREWQKKIEEEHGLSE